MPPKRRGLWSQEQLQQAMVAVRQGTPVRTASLTYGIPRRTLRNHIASGITKKRMGRATVLTEAQENDLCQRIFRLSEIGLPLTSKILKRSVFNYCNQFGIDNPFPDTNKMAGRKWFRLFLNRHPEVAKRRAQHMNAARAAKLNKYIVNDHFQRLRHLLEEMNLMNKPHLIYNMDEKGCRLTLHKQPQAKRGSSNVHIIAEEHAENVTIGQVIPPMILMKGKRQKEEWSENLPPGSVIKMTDKGSMSTGTFVKWLQHFSQYKPAEEVLLIFDGASSHLDYSIVESAEKYKITLYCLPSNTTHQLQPMDKSVFGPFESYWDDEVLLFWMNRPNHRITKLNFATLFSKVWPRAVTPANVSSGFRATGIYPFDPNVIPDSAFAPSELTIRRTLQPENNQADKSDRQNNDESQSLQSKNTNQDESPAKKRHNTKVTSRDTKENQNECLLDKNKILKATQKDQSIVAGPSGLQKTKFTKKRKRFDSDSSSLDSDYSLRDSSSGDESFNDLISAQENSSDLEQEAAPKFNKILPTPELDEKKTTPKRKSLNYRAQKVTKNLFKSKTSDEINISKNKNKPQKSKQKKVLERWYCHLCNQDRMVDMRLCNMCMRYIHEECVGLSASDKEPSFICPSCNEN